MKLKETERASDYIGRFETLIQMKSGRIVAVDKRRLNENPFLLLTNPPDNEITIPALKSSAAVVMRLSGEGPMQMTMLGLAVDGFGVDDADFSMPLVRLYSRDGNQPCMLMNNPIHTATLFGPGGRMYPLPEALYVDEDRALAVVFTNISGEEQLARIVAVGAKYTALQDDPSTNRVKKRLSDAQFLSMPYFYTFDKGVAVLTAYQSASFQITIDNAHNFEIHQISAISSIDDESFSLDIIDLTKGESIINAPRGTHYEVPNTLICGNGSYPYRLHEPVIVFGGQRLLVNITDLVGNSEIGNTIYLTLGGRALKIRKWSP